MTLLSAYRSSVGKKAVMAVTGLLLLGFVIGHLAGNLLIFAGPDAFNAYAYKLKSLGPLLWVARISLLVIVLAHIVSSVMLTLENREARPVGYFRTTHVESTYASRTMMISGILIFAYIVYHLLHFTVRITNPDISYLITDSGHHDVYSMVVLSFSQWPISGVYLIAMFLLCSHLSHGISSAFQSLGLNDERTIPVSKWIGLVIAAAIFIGYVSIPLAVLLDYVTVPGGPS